MKKFKLLDKLISIISSIMTPVIGLISAGGLMKGLIALLISLNIVNTVSSTYSILNAIADTIFTFLPIFLGFTCADVFKMDKISGALIGTILVYPSLSETFNSGEAIFTLFKGSFFETNAYQKFFGIPVFFPNNGYTSTILPIILIIFFASYVEKIAIKISPKSISFIFIPFLTTLISCVIGFLVIGPIANILQSGISGITEYLVSTSPWLAAIVLSLIYQPLLIVGLHWAVNTICLMNYGTLGYCYIMPYIFIPTFAQLAVVLAVAVKTKDKKTKEQVIPCIICGLTCTMEPMYYSFSLTDKKRFVIALIGTCLGSLVLVPFNVIQYSFGTGIMGFAGFINPNNGSIKFVLIELLAVVVCMIFTFIVVLLTYKEVSLEDKDEE